MLDVTTGAVIKGPISTAITVGDKTRADELCHDDNNHIILIANDASSPSPFVTFISSTSFSILGKIVRDGTNGTPNATGGIEQCQWSPRTGKFYLNVPTQPRTLMTALRAASPVASLKTWRGMLSIANRRRPSACVSKSASTKISTVSSLAYTPTRTGASPKSTS